MLDKLRLVVKNYLFKDSFLLISVNICLYNSTKYIQETLDSVFSQTYQDFEVIAIDDGSSDGTYEFIKERYNDPRLKLYRQDNHGLGYTRNRCAELSVGEYIALLDQDDVWYEDNLHVKIEAIRNCHYEPSLIFSDNDNYDDEKKEFFEINKKYILKPNLFETFLLNKECIISLPTVIINRKIFDKGFRFKNYKIAEDYHAWLNISHDFPEYIYIPLKLCLYRIHRNSSTFKYSKLLFNKKNTCYQRHLLKKNISYLYLTDGHKLLSQNNFSEARNYFLKSINYTCLNINPYWGLMKLLLKLNSKHP